MTDQVTYADKESWLDTIWSALDSYREKLEAGEEETGGPSWDDVCTAMAWIGEELGMDPEVDDTEHEAWCPAVAVEDGECLCGADQREA